ncbi:hypothetical protein [Hymenobacter volaticus]|nr:hypothetical protein [Hymenobacter volaticus]
MKFHAPVVGLFDEERQRVVGGLGALPCVPVSHRLQGSKLLW